MQRCVLLQQSGSAITAWPCFLLHGLLLIVITQVVLVVSGRCEWQIVAGTCAECCRAWG